MKQPAATNNRHNRDQVAALHVVVNKTGKQVAHARQIVGRDGEVINHKCDHALQISRGNTIRWQIQLGAARELWRVSFNSFCVVITNEFEKLDVLLLAVVVQIKICELQVLNDLIVLVGNDRVSLHEICRNPNDIFGGDLLRRFLGWVLAKANAGRKNNGKQRGKQFVHADSLGNDRVDSSTK